MDLLEYQAKQLFQQVGIPVLPSQPIYEPGELKNLHILYPIVLKSQVRASGRAKVGGVKFVENTIDAIAAAQSIFHLPIENEYPEVILAEARYDVENELFLAIMLDYHLKKPVLLGSSAGGIDIETLVENLQTCVIDSEFSPFYARHLVKQMGFSGKIILLISEIIEKMYHLFISQDLEVIEINPLGINVKGEVMALDGKIRVNDEALARHPHLLDLIGIHPSENLASYSDLTFPETNHQLTHFELEKTSDLAIIANSIDLAILTSNLVMEQKEKVNSCFILPCQPEKIFRHRFQNLIDQIVNDIKIKRVLVNMSVNPDLNNYIIDTLIYYYRSNFNDISTIREERLERPTGKRIKVVNTTTKQRLVNSKEKIIWSLRMINLDLMAKQAEIKNFPLKISHDLEQAIQDIIATKTKAKTVVKKSR
jgi:succinyl-CoA synthetase beta subunit